MSRKTSLNSKSSATGNGAAAEPLDVADVPDKLLESLHFAEEILRLAPDGDLKDLARKIVDRIDPCITAMSAAVDRLIATAPVGEDAGEAGSNVAFERIAG
jgi:hypothetical protein